MCNGLSFLYALGTLMLLMRLDCTSKLKVKKIRSRTIHCWGTLESFEFAFNAASSEPVLMYMRHCLHSVRNTNLHFYQSSVSIQDVKKRHETMFLIRSP